MPNQPKTPVRGFRIPDDLWDEFARAAETAGLDRTSVIRALMAWYAGRDGADLPERPEKGSSSSD